MSRHHRTGNTKAVGMGDVTVMKTVASALNATDTARGHALNRLVERTGEAMLLLSDYIVYRMEVMTESLDDATPSAFTNRLRNRSNGIIRACDEFNRTLEPYIKGEEKQKAHLWFSDVLSQALDSLFDDMHRDEPETTLQLRRRAKLRYHDPYPDHVKERTEAFEDGYTKGYTDAMDDFIREVAKLGASADSNLSVDIKDGQIQINKIN